MSTHCMLNAAVISGLLLKVNVKTAGSSKSNQNSLIGFTELPFVIWAVVQVQLMEKSRETAATN